MKPLWGFVSMGMRPNCRQAVVLPSVRNEMYSLAELKVQEVRVKTEPLQLPLLGPLCSLTATDRGRHTR